MLKSMGIAAIRERVLLPEFRLNRNRERSRHIALPQPPMRTKTSMKVFEMISVGACPLPASATFIARPGSRILWETPSRTLLPWMPKNHMRLDRKTNARPMCSESPMLEKTRPAALTKSSWKPET